MALWRACCHMLFRVVLTVSDFFVEPKGDERVAFHLGGPRDIKVYLMPEQQELEQGLRSDITVCTITAATEPEAVVRQGFEALSAGRVPEDAPAEARQRWKKFLDEDGRVEPQWLLPLSILPRPMRDFIEDIRGELVEAGKDVVRASRWRFGASGGHDPFSSRPQEDGWSLDGEKWYGLPLTTHVSVESSRLYKATEATRPEIERLLETGSREPIGHTLFREAWAQRHSNPRSALVIGIAAAEVAFKEFVSDLVPLAQWLMKEIPSPPLPKMLRRYLPALPTRLKIQGEAKPPPKQVHKLLQRGIELRNDIVHVPATAVSAFEVEDILSAVQDTLWLLDYYRGHEWALDYLQHQTREQLMSDRP